MSAKTTVSERNESIATLREWIKPGSTIFVIVTHVARSGMQRNIKTIAIDVDPTCEAGVHTYNLAYHISRALGWGYSESDDAVKVGGCGMDMGWHLVDTLSRVLYPEAAQADRLKCRWL